MKVRVSMVAAALAVCLQPATPPEARQAVASRPGEVSEAEQEVRKLERSWLDAYERRDVGAMEAIVDEDFMITFPNGRIQTRPQIIESLKAAGASTGPPPRFFTEEVRSRAYGETVILTGRVVTEWKQNGGTNSQQSRYTDTYVRRNGRWQVVASHLSHAAVP